MNIYMKTKTTVVIIISILLVSLCTVAATYSVIIDVTENNGLKEMVSEIRIKDLLTNDNGSYNSIYYDIKNEVNATNEEANILMESPEINKSLQIVLKSVVDYKANNNTNAKLSNEELYNLISASVLDTTGISDELKSRIINKASIYRNDISSYIYDIEISTIGAIKWPFTYYTYLF